MARSRRKGSRRRAPVMRRARPDWVYNSESYTSVDETLSPGTASQLAIALYDSYNVRRSIKYGQVNFVGLNTANSASSYLHGDWERAEGRRPIIHAIEAVIKFVPSTWTLASRIASGFRFLVAQQNGLVGSAILDASYSMWQENPALGSPLARWANERRMLAETRAWRGFDDTITSPQYTTTLRWTGKWRLAPEEALFLFCEAQTGSAEIRFNTYCRTLVSDEG